MTTRTHKASATVKTVEAETVKPIKANAVTAKRLMRALELRSLVKEMMQEAEAIESGLLDSLTTDVPYKLPDGRMVKLVDNFAVKNQVWKSTAFRQYELKVV